MKQVPNGLLKLHNVGNATYKDLQLLGISCVTELAESCPDELFIRLQAITNQTHDPCMWDIFAAAIHEARTGEKLPWWKWTPVRKERQANGVFRV